MGIEGSGWALMWHLLKKYGCGEILSIIPPSMPTISTHASKDVNVLYLPEPAQLAPVITVVELEAGPGEAGCPNERFFLRTSGWWGPLFPCFHPLALGGQIRALCPS